MLKIYSFSGFDVIRTAMEIEIAGHAFYSEMSKLAKLASLRHLFAQLAEDEDRHLLTLQKLTEGQFKDGGFWDDEEDYLPYFKSFKEVGLFPEKEKFVATLDETDADRQILELAIAAENRFAEYFAIAAFFAQTDEGKEAFSLLAYEERRHAELLGQRLTGFSIGQL